ncbi:SCAN domain-containing protein 3-like [Palaemon carinicauda]|uniref:SCAN domain-containing protein 3-like n=1 Tax=Palaemon carinicauda TaxID=392227 RepID=UPI0035B69341
MNDIHLVINTVEKISFPVGLIGTKSRRLRLVFDVAYFTYDYMVLSLFDAEVNGIACVKIMGFRQNNIPLKNIIACATDGAPSMTGRYKGFIAHLKKAVPELQGKDSDLISSRSAIVAFLRKLQLYKNNIRRRAFEQFPCLASVSSDLQDEDLALYGEYMEIMHTDMQNRFSDLLMMVIQTWVSIPFEVNVADIDISLQEPLIDLQSDEIMRAKFKDGKCNVWKTNDVATKYPLLWDRAQIYVIAFPTSYLVESGFSRVSQLLSKARNRLGIVKTGDLRLSLTSMEPTIKKLAEQHQPQGPH